MFLFESLRLNDALNELLSENGISKVFSIAARNKSNEEVTQVFGIGCFGNSLVERMELKLIRKRVIAWIN